MIYVWKRCDIDISLAREQLQESHREADEGEPGV